MILEILVGIALISIIPILYIITRSIYVGNWRHLDIDNHWDANKSRGRIQK